VLGMGIDGVFVCLPRPAEAGVRESDARSGSSRDRFLVFMDRCGFPGPGEMDVVLFGRGAGLFAFDAELPMLWSRSKTCSSFVCLLFGSLSLLWSPVYKPPFLSMLPSD